MKKDLSDICCQFIRKYDFVLFESLVGNYSNFAQVKFATLDGNMAQYILKCYLNAISFSVSPLNSLQTALFSLLQTLA